MAAILSERGRWDLDGDGDLDEEGDEAEYEYKARSRPSNKSINTAGYVEMCSKLTSSPLGVSKESTRISSRRQVPIVQLLMRWPSVTRFRSSKTRTIRLVV